jgi:hypothetical protein
MPVEDFPSTGDVNMSKLPKLPHIGSLFGTTHFKQYDGRDEYLWLAMHDRCLYKTIDGV